MRAPSRLTPPGYETLSIVGIRDPYILSHLDVWLGHLRAVLEDRVRSALDLGAGQYDLTFHCYGANAVLGPLEDSDGPPREIGLLFKVHAPTQATAATTGRAAPPGGVPLQDHSAPPK